MNDNHCDNPFAIGDDVDKRMMINIDAESIVGDYIGEFNVDTREEVEPKLRSALKNKDYFKAQLKKYSLDAKDYLETLIHVYPKMFNAQLVKSIQEHMKIKVVKKCKK